MDVVELQPAALPLVLMSIAGPIGAFDVIFFHLWRFRLYSAPSARFETVTHLLRGLTFAAGAYMLATYRVGGAWFWIIGAMFVFDLVNTVVDVLLEPRSRAALGGLPRAEYVVHIIGSAFAGAITVSFLTTAWSNRLDPTELLASRHTLPGWLIVNGQVLAAGAALLTLFELGLYLHSLHAPQRAAATA